MDFFKKWLRNHQKFLLHFLIHIDVNMLCSKFELIQTSILSIFFLIHVHVHVHVQCNFKTLTDSKVALNLLLVFLPFLLCSPLEMVPLFLLVEMPLV